MNIWVHAKGREMYNFEKQIKIGDRIVIRTGDYQGAGVIVRINEQSYSVKPNDRTKNLNIPRFGYPRYNTENCIMDPKVWGVE